MLINFLLLTVGLWVELVYFAYLYVGNLASWSTVPSGGHLTFIAEQGYWTCRHFMQDNLMFDKIYALFVIPTMLGAIVLLLRLLMARASATKQP